MLSANEQTIRIRFFFADTAWWIPNAVSTFEKRTSAAWRTFSIFPEFPDTAAAGDTFDARFAGDCAASSTVRIPTTMPKIIPIMLIPKTGISENSALTSRITAQSPHVTTMPGIIPAGTAILHQFSASSRTKHRICFLLAPIQRIMPKNLERSAISLFKLPAIIKTPASKINTNKIAATA